MGGIDWVQENEEDGNIAKDAEKAKKAFAGCELEGKKLGVIGLGAIGSSGSQRSDSIWAWMCMVMIRMCLWSLHGRLSRGIHHAKNCG